VAGDDGRRERILRAAFDLFMVRGYAGFSLAEVAEQAGVREAEVTDIGGRPDLVAAATNYVVPEFVPCADDQGSLRAELVVATRSQVAFQREHGHAVERCLNAIKQSAEFASAARAITHERLEAYRPIFDRARSRGEIDHDIDFDEFVDVLSAPLLGRMFSARTFEEDAVEDAVDLVLKGLKTRDT
jgi:hypothetical protein